MSNMRRAGFKPAPFYVLCVIYHVSCAMWHVLYCFLSGCGVEGLFSVGVKGEGVKS